MFQSDTTSECSEEDKEDVNFCPVSALKQDGHHARAQYLGYDEKALLLLLNFVFGFTHCAFAAGSP